MAMRLTAADIARALGKAKQHNGYWMACCPAHEDANPSLSIRDEVNGQVRFRCLAACADGAVREALTQRGLLNENGQPRRAEAEKARRPRVQAREHTPLMPVPSDAPRIDWRTLHKAPPSAVYEYRAASGELNFLVARFDRLDGKEFRPAVFADCGAGARRWLLAAPPAPRPLFGLEELARRPDAPVLVVEGEKTALAARRLAPDHAALSWWGGAKAVGHTDWAPLSGRSVVLWADADEAGAKAMSDAALALARAGARSVARVKLPPGLPSGWDLADDIPPGVEVAALLRAASAPDEGLTRLIMSAAELARLDIPPREHIVAPFLPTHSLAMLYAERGLGKTWLALTLAAAVCGGESFLGYAVGAPRGVLYVDGEMALADLQERVAKVSHAPENLLLLPSERLFREDRPLNINDAEDQARIAAALESLDRQGRRPDLIIFDNLSSLSGGVDENDNSALDALLRWLIALRHQGYAILLVHHAGKNGSQRGASRREDLLDTSIALVRPEPDAAHHDGAHFILKFMKTRGKPPQPAALELKLVANEGRLVWAITQIGKGGAERQVHRALAAGFHGTQKELAAQVGVSGGRVSQALSALRAQGVVARDALGLTALGRQRAIDLFPDLAQRLQRQGDLLKDDPI